METCILIVGVAVCIGAAVVSWWSENGESHEVKKKSADDEIMSVDQINFTRLNMEDKNEKN